MALTREPSARRASQIGEDSSTRRPTWLTMRWQMLSSCWLSRKRMPVRWILPPTSMNTVPAPLTMMSAISSRDSNGSSGPYPRTSLQMSSSSSSCSAIDITMFLIAMISLTMSRISSRADFAVELGELGEIDRLDQRAEDRRLDLVIGVRSPRVDDGRGRRRFGRRERRRGNDRRCRVARSRRRPCPEADSDGAPAGFVARVSISVPLRLPNTTILHAGGYLARSFSIRGDRNEPRGFLVSPRPVSRCAICRNISVVRCPAEISAIIWPLLAAEPNICGSNGMDTIGGLSIALANSLALISGRFGTPT